MTLLKNGLGIFSCLFLCFVVYLMFSTPDWLRDKDFVLLLLGSFFSVFLFLYVHTYTEVWYSSEMRRRQKAQLLYAKIGMITTLFTFIMMWLKL